MGQQPSKDHASNYTNKLQLNNNLNEKENKKYRRYTIHHKRIIKDIVDDDGNDTNCGTTFDDCVAVNSLQQTQTHLSSVTYQKNNNNNPDTIINNNNLTRSTPIIPSSSSTSTSSFNFSNSFNIKSNNNKKRREKSKTINLGKTNQFSSSSSSIQPFTSSTSTSTSFSYLTDSSTLSISSGISNSSSNSFLIDQNHQHQFNRTRSKSLNCNNNNNIEISNISKSNKIIQGRKSRSSTALFKNLSLKKSKEDKKKLKQDKKNNKSTSSSSSVSTSTTSTTTTISSSASSSSVSSTSTTPILEPKPKSLMINETLKPLEEEEEEEKEFIKEEYQYQQSTDHIDYQIVDQAEQEEYYYSTPTPAPKKKPPPLPPKNFKPSRLSMDPPLNNSNVLLSPTKSSILGKKLSNLIPPMEPDYPSTCGSSQRSSVELHYLQEVCNYILLEKIGSGTFSDVHLCCHKETDKRFAIKVIDKSLVQMIATHTDLDISTEVNILKSLSHPNIIQLFDHFETDNNYYIVMELLHGGELLYQIENNSKIEGIELPLPTTTTTTTTTTINNSTTSLEYANYTEDSARKIIKQIIEAVEFLHKNEIIHRDLKPENILFRDASEYSSLKIIDFGLASYSNNGTPLVDVCGTPDFQAPEMIKRQGYSYPVDIWATGVILYILLCGHPPFQGKNSMAIMSLIMRAEIKFEQGWENVSSLAKELVMKMLDPDPFKRLTASQVLEHEWIKQESMIECESPRLGSQFHRQLRRYNSQRYFKATGDTILKSQRYSIYSPDQLKKRRSIQL